MRGGPRAVLAILVAALAIGVAGCGGGGSGGENGSLTVYSGRAEEFVGPLFKRFEDEKGINLDVRYDDSAQLAAAIAEEGDNSPADVFFAQDAGSLGAVAAEGRFVKLPMPTLNLVDARFRDPDGRWVGLSGRARVIVYNTEMLTEDQVPDTVFEVTDPRWKGKLGIAPTNASFQAFVSAMRLESGEQRARQWLEDLKANEPKTYENNVAVVAAVAAGEIEIGLVNHYYLYELKAEEPDAPAANHFTDASDPGSLVNVAGVGILATSEKQALAQQLVDYLLTEPSQRYYTEDGRSEYPLIAGVPPLPDLPPISDIHGITIRLSDLGAKLPSTLELLNEVGLTS
jgi:iron(III) transport system substrate-binding protein